MSLMFNECSSLKKLNINNLNTNKVKEMSWMFNYCNSLDKLNLSNFDTSNVTDMDNMFRYCSSLKELNLDNFNTQQANVENMFLGCSSELNLKIKTQYKNIKNKAFK